MLKPTKGQPGAFIDTIVVPESYKEVEPRKFVLGITLGEYREDDKFDTIRIYPTKGTFAKWRYRRIWLYMRIGEVLCDISYIFETWGLRLTGYSIEDLKEDSGERQDNNSTE